MTFCIRGHYNLKRLKIADQTATNRPCFNMYVYDLFFRVFHEVALIGIPDNIELTESG